MLGVCITFLGAIESWRGQGEGLRLYSSYQDAVGIDGEAIEFELKHFPGFSLLCILQEIQQDLERRNIQPEEFKDHIISKCHFECRKVKNYAMRFSQGHWKFVGPGQEEKWCGSSSYAQKGEWCSTANIMVQRFKETGHLVFKSISALSRGILKRKKGKETVHFNGDSAC